jgi:hypothetical protein
LADHSFLIGHLYPDFHLADNAASDGAQHESAARPRFASAAYTFRNRLVMAPMTRSHTDDADTPSDLAATHYAQRTFAAYRRGQSNAL